MRTTSILTIFLIILAASNANSQQMGLFNKTKAKPFDIDSILQLADDAEIVMTIHEHLNTITDYGERMDKLTEPQKTLLYIENLEAEINNGGFNQFYFNSSGDFSHETVDALLIIGANKTAEIVKKANAQYPDNKVPNDRYNRQVILMKIEDTANKTWNECDDLFYKYQDNLAQLLVEYIKANKEDFKK